MKDYEVVWKCNKWGHYEALEDKYRDVYTSYFKSCENLVVLVNRVHILLSKYDNGFYPEIISITEV